ncbi:Protein kinase domain-containing protein [Mesobacillus persicus]|uniref:Protein kinase domain-containing protein n=1 Tax=Mesobacillus persicus TaxID=930146 RepID=A0A1H7ZA76_9BACI|nr:RIO1 family regulatory kinase/ATPase [Mesobacillus persicus]SEM55121.1 Protein kinase domain-containing protein [Mesobacillus persicus]
MKSFSELAKSVSFTRKGSKVKLNDKDPALELIGTGRSAYVFKIKDTNKVLKVFFPPYEQIAQKEAEIYKMLSGNIYYPSIYDSGEHYLVIDYIAGNTLFDCLVKGIEVTANEIREIDKALSMAREKGLNPSDIHLRNIILTKDDQVKIIDVARFKQTKKCKQWADIKAAYKKFYHRRLFPKKAPELILNLIAFLYKKKMIPYFR